MTCIIDELIVGLDALNIKHTANDRDEIKIYIRKCLNLDEMTIFSEFEEVYDTIVA